MSDTIIFDLDGVIIDSESIWDKSQAVFLERRGCTYDREKVKHILTGTSMVEGSIILQKMYGFPGDPEELAKERIEITKDLFGTEVNFVPGFQDFYENVRGKYKLAIGTSLDRQLLEVIDKRMGLRKLFYNNVWCIEDVGNLSKPDPAIFLYAAKMLKSSPESCVVIEDSPRGIEAAKNAGMKCIGLATTYDRSKLSAADLIVNSYSEIKLNGIFL